MSEYAFVVTQVGEKGSVERRRADEVSDYVVKPLLEKRGLILERADRDPTPGQITPQLLRKLLEAKVVIVDLTGRNANVYYELAIAHSFSRPVISLVDEIKNVAFDTKDERSIVLGKYESSLSVQQAEEAKEELGRALDVVLAAGYLPSSLVSEVASARSIDDLAPDNPLASEIAGIRETLEEVHAAVQGPRRVVSPAMRADLAQLRAIVEEAVERTEISVSTLNSADFGETSAGFDNWHMKTLERLEELLAPPSKTVPPSFFSDEPPF